VTVSISGVFESDKPGEDNVAYTHLEFLQRTKGADSLGHVTQFDVEISDASKAEGIAAAIDGIFRTEETPTSTKSHKAFLQAETGELLTLIGFTRWLGLLCVVVVLALTGNTVYVMVQDRVREHAVLQTLGFTSVQLFFIVIAESLALAATGGMLGTVAAAGALRFGNLGIGAEGIQISFVMAPAVMLAGFSASILTGLLAGALPALKASTAPIVDSLRRA
jgi:putative ABC transport system permease protein